MIAAEQSQFATIAEDRIVDLHLAIGCLEIMASKNPQAVKFYRHEITDFITRLETVEESL